MDSLLELIYVALLRYFAECAKGMFFEQTRNDGKEFHQSDFSSHRRSLPYPSIYIDSKDLTEGQSLQSLGISDTFTQGDLPLLRLIV